MTSRAELRDELLAHVAVDEQALAGRAALAGAEEARGDGRLGGEVEIGVLEDDHRAVAAELEHRGLAGGRLGDPAAGLGRADEADAVRARVARDLVADDGAGAGDEVEDAGRQVGLGDALGEGDAGDRGRRGRRPHDGVAAGERGRDQLGRHRVRPVPGRDHADHAARPAQEQDALVRRRSSWARVPPAASRPRPRCASTATSSSTSSRDSASGLPWSSVSVCDEALAAPLDLVGDAVHRGRALERARARPALGGPVRRGDRPLRVLAAALAGPPRSSRRSPATRP